ncbi:auxin-responsive protein SAUR71-like [Abeliophyllum distichum]|uniref:Auxin-responsive protein SAUR71-like n=1 Tax=Abeliophyllum distichum TaxID=126358 RepID=A0ABD1UH59_9LAMI
MKRLIRRLARVADSSEYSLLRSESRTRRRRTVSFRNTGWCTGGTLAGRRSMVTNRKVFCGSPATCYSSNECWKLCAFVGDGAGGVEDSRELQDLLNSISDEFR